MSWGPEPVLRVSGQSVSRASGAVPSAAAVSLRRRLGWIALWAGSLMCVSAPLAADAAPKAKEAECRVPGHRHALVCGQLTRPLNPEQPSGPSFELHYVKMPAVARRKLPDPVFMIVGGPGQSAIELMPQLAPLFQRLNNRRDIVFVDQRGTGRSLSLACENPRRAGLLDSLDERQRLAEALACRDRLAKLPQLGGVDGLRHFHTMLATQDLDAVRAQLGAERINLVGVSYGTRAALDYQRQHPNRVRRAVLDGVAPPDMALPASQSLDAQAAWESLLSFCAQDPACREDHPALRARWESLLASLPRTVTVADPWSGEPQTLTLRREDVLSAVRAALYSPVRASALPSAVQHAAEGRAQALLGLAASMSHLKSGGVAAGMHFSVICTEDLPQLPRSPDPAGRDFGTAQRDFYQQVCAQWPRTSLPGTFYTVPSSVSPVLLLSGGLDPATPPRHAARVAQALGPKARHLVVRHAGHGVFSLGCVRETWVRFIDEGTDEDALAVPLDCARDVPRPPVFRVVRPASGVEATP